MELKNYKNFASLDANGVVDHHTMVNYSHSLMDCSTVSNGPIIGGTYDSNLNAFIPPKPNETYILTTERDILGNLKYVWEPDPNLEYTIDGADCRWSPKLKEWITLQNWSDEEHL